MFLRTAACAGLFALSALLVARHPGPAAAQGKDVKKEAALEKQVVTLRQELLAAERQVAVLKAEVNQLQAANTQAQAALKKATGGDKSVQAALDGYRGAGLIHVVVLKSKSDTPSGEAQSLTDDAYAQLTKIKGVRGLWAGKPAAKGTPDAAADYTVALVLAFDDAAGLKAYLNDPAHTKFADKHLKSWETPVVYDFEPRKPKP